MKSLSPLCYTPAERRIQCQQFSTGLPVGGPFTGDCFPTPSVPDSAYMETIFARLALVLIVAVIVGGATYVVLTIMEILQKK